MKAINDADRTWFFDNYNIELMNRIRSIKRETNLPNSLQIDK